MSESSMVKLSCTQCGGDLHPDEGAIFLACPYCGATVYLDKSKVVFHWALAPTLNAEQAAGQLARWMSGNQTVKDLDKKARVTGQAFQYFPLWYFKWGTEKSEQTGLQPGAATSITELRRLLLPAGDLRSYSSSLDAQSVEPTVPLDAALDWFRQEHPNLDVRESALVHVPIYLFKYDYKNRTYTAVVEAATGVVLANIFPAKAEAPYILAGLLTALVYLCLAGIPLVGGVFDSQGGLMGAGVIALILGIIAAPFLFALAVWVASKV